MKEYLKTYYGKCIIESCTCLKEGRILGTLCPNWKNLEYESFEEMIEHAQQIRELMEKR